MSKEEKEYLALLVEVSKPLADKIDTLEEHEVRDYFKVLLDASERSLRDILFIVPKALGLRKHVTVANIEIWLRKVSLAMMAYSYYFYGDDPMLENDPVLSASVNISYKAYWQNMYEAYNQIFNQTIGQEQIDYYAAGLREDDDKGYSKAFVEGKEDMQSQHFDKSIELDTKDYTTIGSELLKEIWHQDLKEERLKELKRYRPGSGAKLSAESKKAMILGLKIWKAYEYNVQPFLTKMLTDH